ncbi:MAG: hypothetical protein R3362_05285 [Rhodothermales bacterium]|nr:hypothetical protein [Rhodothermales bacterium]
MSAPTRPSFRTDRCRFVPANAGAEPELPAVLALFEAGHDVAYTGHPYPFAGPRAYSPGQGE